MGIVTAKKRFIPNSPVQTGVIYRHTVNGKAYNFQALFNKTLSEFNPIFFRNLTPKEYRYKRITLAASSLVLANGDKLILTDKNRSYTNNQFGFVEKAELQLLTADTKNDPMYTESYTRSDGTERIRVKDIYPFVNLNYEETKYFQIDDYGMKLGIVLLLSEDQEYRFVVKETFTPVRAGSSNVHVLRVAKGSYTTTYSGIQPDVIQSTYVEYYIPNTLTTRNLQTIFTGSSCNLIMN